MIDELFSIGSFSISPFGVMLVLALLSAYWQLRRGLVHGKLGDEEDASAIVFACGIAGIAGGKIYYAILVGDWGMLLDRAGIVWYGSLIGGALAFIWSTRRRGLPLAPTFDAAAPALPLGYAVGRVGCFLVGDDYGIPTDSPLGVVFENGLPPTTAGVLRRDFGIDVPAEIADSALVAVHPTQLYTTFASLGIMGLALWLRGRYQWRAGSLFIVVLMLMSTERFLVEFLRAKDDRFFGHFTLAQLISVIIFVGLSVLLWRRGLKRPEAPGDGG